MKAKIGILEYDCISCEEEFTTTEDGSLHTFKIMLSKPITNNANNTLEKLANIESELKNALYKIIIINNNKEKIIYIDNFYQIFYDDESFILFFNMSI